jgi:hypothetical protein
MKLQAEQTTEMKYGRASTGNKNKKAQHSSSELSLDASRPQRTNAAGRKGEMSTHTDGTPESSSERKKSEDRRAESGTKAPRETAAEIQ